MNIYRGRSHTEVYLASVLYDAIDDQDYSSIITLLTIKKADPNLVLPRRGISPFHLIIGSDSPDFAFKVTSLIIQHGGDPNVRSDEGLTPVHIAAAWDRTEILQLLLNCGGDPEITDNCYKNALHYSVDEGHEKATKIIRDFIDFQCVSALADFWSKIPCNLTLDKIIVNNGGTIGEYELAKTDKDAIVSEDLNKLPQTNSNEYVLNWCNSQVLNNHSHTCEISDDISLSTSQEIKRNYVNYKPRNVCYNRQSSRESGFATLPESLTDDKNINDYLGYVLLKTDSDASTDDVTNNVKIKSKDTSSDYYTCTEASEDANILEQNIYEISSSLSSIGLDDQDMTASVSISEVYQYNDVEEGVVLFEKRLLTPCISSSQNESSTTATSKSSKLSSLPKSFDYNTDSLRKELTNIGYDPGPITKTTKRLYLRKLYHLKRHPEIIAKEEINFKKVYSNELEKTLREPNWSSDLTVFNKLEAEITREFSNPDPTRRWREGVNKSSFTYLLLDPRVTKNLPCRSDNLSQDEVWQTFLSSIFYVGKGKRSRPYSHLYDAINSFSKGDLSGDSDKLKQIIEIWRDNRGVICLHVFQNVIPVEAYTREAAMLGALKIDNVTNLKSGDFYGVAATWTKHQKNLLGVLLLYKAMKIFLNEGERQLSPHDID